MAKRLTQDQFESQVYRKYGNKYSVIGKYVKWDVPIDIKCNQCGTIITKIPNSITSIKANTCCPVCDHSLITNKVVIGVDDLWTTRPDVASMLSNQNDGYKYSSGSNKKVLFICPVCSMTIKRSITSVYSRGLSCQYCSDGISYPNKFMANLLNINNIKYDTEYRIGSSKYRYDFYFAYNQTKYLIEMDGGFGHGCVDTPTRTIADQVYDDNKKSMLAKENGYVLIRIDCKYTGSDDRFNYVKRNVLDSVLVNILKDMSDDVFERCNNISSTSSILVDIANDWNNGVKSYDELCTNYKLCRHSIRKYLKNASIIGLISESYSDILKEIRLASNIKLSKSKGQPVICNETGEVFYSIAEAQRNGYNNIGAYLSGTRNYSGRLRDGTKLTWKKITYEEYLKHAS